MKTILINDTPKNIEKINNELEKVQKNCRTRILNIEDIKNIIKDIEKMLQARRLPKTAWEDLKITVKPFLTTFAKSYKYIPYGTSLKLIYSKKAWRIISIDRDIASGSPNRRIIFEFTDDQKKRMLNELQYNEL